jgi:hypothetical protein
MIGRDVETFALMIICGEDCFLRGSIGSKMHLSPAKSAYRAENCVTIGFLVHTYTLPSIFLVVQFHSSALSITNEIIGGITG